MGEGPYLLLAENDRERSSLLRLFDASAPESPLKQVAAARVSGHVLQRPILRGSQLFVASTSERLTAFALVDEKGKPPLSRVATHQVESPRDGAMYLAAGPNDRLWMASSTLRQFQLTLDRIIPDDRPIAVGFSSQPLQTVGETIFFAGRRPLQPGCVLPGREPSTHGQDSGSWCWADASSHDDRARWRRLNRLRQRAPERCSASRPTPSPAEVCKPGSSRQLGIPANVETPIGSVRLTDGRLAVFAGRRQAALLDCQRRWQS